MTNRQLRFDLFRVADLALIRITNQFHVRKLDGPTSQSIHPIPAKKREERGIQTLNPAAALARRRGLDGEAGEEGAQVRAEAPAGRRQAQPQDPQPVQQPPPTQRFVCSCSRFPPSNCFLACLGVV
jgi:hypothetical protein